MSESERVARTGPGLVQEHKVNIVAKAVELRAVHMMTI
jgi:hypothetical protein